MHIHIDQKAYGENTILRQVDLPLERGDAIALMGPSGIGKSTILRIAAGLDQDFSGSVSKRPKAIGMVFQEPLLLNWRSALDNLLLMSNARESDAIAQLDALGLEGLAARLPQELSIGQQRRVSLGRALIVKPDLLLLDEAFASLDRETARIMRQRVREYTQKTRCTLLMATHLPEDLEIATKVYRIENGRLLEE